MVYEFKYIDNKWTTKESDTEDLIIESLEHEISKLEREVTFVKNENEDLKLKNIQLNYELDTLVDKYYELVKSL